MNSYHQLSDGSVIEMEWKVSNGKMIVHILDEDHLPLPISFGSKEAAKSYAEKVVNP